MNATEELNGSAPAVASPAPRERLSVLRVARDPEDEQTVRVVLNERPNDADLEQWSALPPAPQIARDLGEMVRRAMTAEIVARVCRVYVLSGVVMPMGAEVVNWLRDYMDGKGHGPCGGPLGWPDLIPPAARMLREWGFERSPNGWVVRAGTSTGAPEGVKPS